MDLSWYMTLAKPALTPPSALFGPVWTILYCLMAASFILILRARGIKAGIKRQAIWLFIGQLILNLVWSPIFFSLKQPGWALLNLIVMWWAIFVTIKAFRRVSNPAAWLMVPYIAWVTFAEYLNAGIWLLNR